MGKTTNITIKIGAAYDTVQIVSKKTGSTVWFDRASIRQARNMSVLDDIRYIVVSDIEYKKKKQKKKAIRRRLAKKQ